MKNAGKIIIDAKIIAKNFCGESIIFLPGIISAQPPKFTRCQREIMFNNMINDTDLMKFKKTKQAVSITGLQTAVIDG